MVGPPTQEQQIARDIASLTRNPDYYPVPNGKAAILHLNPSEPYYGVFNNFSLLSVGESSDQIVKVHQNFSGNWSAFFMGRKPQIVTFSGFFMDSREYPYYQEFMVAYEKYLAGRKCVENRMRMKVLYDGKIVEGYILTISINTTADTIMMKQFSFSVLITAAPRWIRFNIVDGGTNTRITDGALLSQYNMFSNKARVMQSGMWELIEDVSQF
jgi:hypothetical protein